MASPTPYKTKYTQSALDSAVAAVRAGHSFRQAASDWRVPRSTLIGRVRGSQPADKAHKVQQRLTPQQETELTAWIRAQSAQGRAPTHAQIRATVVRILRANHDHRPLGKKWVEAFLARNKPFKRVPLDPARDVDVGDSGIPRQAPRRNAGLDASVIEISSDDDNGGGGGGGGEEDFNNNRPRTKLEKILNPFRISREVLLAGYDELCSEWQLQFR